MQLVESKALQRQLNHLAKKYFDSGYAPPDGRVSVIVGYTAHYALYVHENIEMKWKGQPRGGGPGRDKKTGRFIKGKGGKGKYWDPQGRAQAKFLEQPAREMGPELARVAREAIRRGASLIQALAIAGLRLQRASQQRVPVDTGNLKGSAFTRKE